MIRLTDRQWERTQTQQLQSITAKDAAMLVWWGSEVECNSALARRERDGALDARAMTLALRRLQQLTDAWHENRAADALQLAAAFVAAERRPPSLASAR
jgi:hypothetical protein